MSLTPAGPAHRASAGARVWVACLAAVLAVHSAVAWNASFPIWLRDEAMPVLAAGHLAGAEPDARFLSSLPYDTGWSLLLVPLWWVTKDPVVVYRLAIGVAVLLAVLSVLPLASVARRLGAGPRVAVCVAALVAVLPARVFESNYTTTENALFLAVACFTAAVFAVSERPTPTRLGLLALACAALPLVHQRSLPMVAVAVVWLLTWRGERRRAGWLGAAAVLVTTAAGYLLNRHLIELVYGAAEGREDALLGTLRQLSPRLVVVSFSGQVWYLTVSTVGLVVLGAVLGARALALDLRRRDLGPGSVVFVCFAGMLAISTAWVVGGILNDQRRLDVYFYGRLVDPIAAVVTLVALVHLLGRRERVRRSVLVASSVLSLLVVWGWTFVVLPRSADDRIQILPLNTPGILAYSWPSFGATSPPYVLIVVVTSLAVLVLTGIGVLRRGRVWGVLLLTVLALTASVRTEASVTTLFNGPGEKACSYGDPLVSRLEAAGFQRAGLVPADDSTYAGLLFCFPHVRVDQLTKETTAKQYTYVVAPNEWTTGFAWGARRIAESTTYNQALYVMPGATQDRLAKEGLLEPPDDDWVDDAAARYAITARSTVPAGAATSTEKPANLDVQVTHAGTGQMWRVGTASFGAGAVYISQDWRCGDLVAEGLRTNLLHTMMPGEVSADIPMVLLPPQDVPSGSSCTVTIGVAGVDKLGIPKYFTGTPLTVTVTTR